MICYSQTLQMTEVQLIELELMAIEMKIYVDSYN
jgi:hypothetical protein